MNWYGTSNSWEKTCGSIWSDHYIGRTQTLWQKHARPVRVREILGHGQESLIVQREDDAGLVKAKLQCMGADLGNIMLYKRRAGGIEYCGFNAGDLRGIVESAGKMHADLVYIDPLHGLAAGRMNDQQSADCLIALDAMAEWMHAAVHLNGNHMLTRELFHQAESKDRRWTPAKLRKAFSLAGLGQTRAAERGSRSIVYLKDPSNTRVRSGTSRYGIHPGNARQGMGRDRATLNYQMERYVPSDNFSASGNINLDIMRG